MPAFSPPARKRLTVSCQSASSLSSSSLSLYPTQPLTYMPRPHVLYFQYQRCPTMLLIVPSSFLRSYILMPSYDFQRKIIIRQHTDQMRRQRHYLFDVACFRTSRNFKSALVSGQFPNITIPKANPQELRWSRTEIKVQYGPHVFLPQSYQFTPHKLFNIPLQNGLKLIYRHSPSGHILIFKDVAELW